MSDAVLEINATQFKAKCLALFKDLETRRYRKIVVTRRGKPIAELTAPKRDVPDIYGALAGRAIIPPDLDLAAPILQDMPEAESGEHGP